RGDYSVERRQTVQTAFFNQYGTEASTDSALPPKRLHLVIPALLAANTSFAAEFVPPSVQPGAIERSLPVQPPPSTNSGVAVPQPPELTAPSGADRIKFRLERLDIAGATALTQDEFKTTYRDFLGKDVSL